MASTTNARDDLGYVRDVVNRSERNAFPAGIAYLWAALAMTIGYVITITVDGFAWTTLGVLYAAGLVISARVAGGGRGQQPG